MYDTKLKFRTVILYLHKQVSWIELFRKRPVAKFQNIVTNACIFKKIAIVTIGQRAHLLYKKFHERDSHC